LMVSLSMAVRDEFVHRPQRALTKENETKPGRGPPVGEGLSLALAMTSGVARLVIIGLVAFALFIGVRRARARAHRIDHGGALADKSLALFQSTAVGGARAHW
jgi:hypothetical protein